MTAERFSELVAAGKVRCRCHKKPLVSRRGQRRWRCCPVRQARDVRYEESAKGRATRARYMKQRYRSPGYVAARERYYSNASGAYGRWRELQERLAAFKAAHLDEYRFQQQMKAAAFREKLAAELQELRKTPGKVRVRFAGEEWTI
jgi:hypothetical protein